MKAKLLKLLDDARERHGLAAEKLRTKLEYIRSLCSAALKRMDGITEGNPLGALAGLGAEGAATDALIAEVVAAGDEMLRWEDVYVDCDD